MLSDALAAKEIKPSGIATALNGTVIPADRRQSTPLGEGDKIVIIKAFYGG
ncbi:MAG: sulfur carrier protein ThiS [Duncaniella sp.]|nr:sulfur carrier protein ThiS [Duncaniella sp.]